VCRFESGKGSAYFAGQVNNRPRLTAVSGTVDNFVLTLSVKSDANQSAGTQWYVIFDDNPCPYDDTNNNGTRDPGESLEWPDDNTIVPSECLEITASDAGGLSWTTLNWSVVDSASSYPYVLIVFTFDGVPQEADAYLELTVDSRCDNTPEPGDGDNTDPGNDTIDQNPGYGFSSDYRLPTVPSPQTLPDTGSSTTMSLMGLGLVLLAAGATATKRSRRLTRT